MFRVPSDPDSPSFDQTFKVGFWRWLTSSGADRKEWARRRNLAAKAAQRGQQQRIDQWAGRKQAEAQAGMDAARAHMQQTQADYAVRVQQIDAQKAERLAEIEAEGAARRAEIHRRHAEQTAPVAEAGLVTFGKFILDSGHIQRGMFDRRPLAGVTATVGDLQRNKGSKAVTAARVLSGSLVATAEAIGRIGAKTLTITGPGFEWREEVPAHKVEQAQAFADRVNAAARQHN